MVQRIIVFSDSPAAYHVNVDLVIHAPGAQALARKALPWLAHAHYGDSAVTLVTAIRRQPSWLGAAQHISVLDAFGPNPGHPLHDASLLTLLQSLLAPQGTVTVIALTVQSDQAQGFGGGFQGFGGQTGRTSAAGFGGMGGFGFSGSSLKVSPHSSVYLTAVQQTLGPAVKVQTVSSLDAAQRLWTSR